jgi:hypothetical protein
MADSDFWRDLAEKFRALPDPDGLLRATWMSERGGPYQWSIESAHVVGGSRSARVRFEVLAARPGVKLENPNGRSSLDAWLDALSKETPNDISGSGTETVEGMHAHIWGSIYHICEASAVFCNILEYRALEAERIAREEESLLAAPTIPQEDAKSATTDSIATERNVLLMNYKREGKKSGIRITDLMVARAASPKWNERTPVQRWKRNDPRCTAGDDAKIRSVLKRKPHLTA